MAAEYGTISKIDSLKRSEALLAYYYCNVDLYYGSNFVFKILL